MSGMSDADLAESPTSLAEIERRLEAQREGLARAHDEIQSLREEIGERDRRIDELEQRVVDLDERTDLRKHIDDASKLKVDERAGVCIQTCVNEAQRRGRNGQPASATMDYNGARKALGGGLADAQLITALRRADELVPGDAVRFKKEKRAAKRNSRLVVDLEAGELPSRFRNGQNSERGSR